MVKDPRSGYSPGRRGLGWLKMKKALATIAIGGNGIRHELDRNRPPQPAVASAKDLSYAIRTHATEELVVRETLDHRPRRLY